MAVVPQNLITALPFWDAKEKQTFRQHYCSGFEEMGAVQCRYDRVLPWTIKNHAATPDEVLLVNREGTQAIDISAHLTIGTTTYNLIDYTYNEGTTDVTTGAANDLYVFSGGSWSLVGTATWAGFVELCGLYYLEVNFGGTRYYSELMQIADFSELSDSTDIESNRCRIECSATCPVGEFPPGFAAQKLFVKSPTARPEYETSKEVSEDGDDEENGIWVKVTKRYTLEWYAIETVADFVSTIPLYSTINFTDQYGFQGPVTNVDYEIAWPDDQKGCLALIRLSFTREYIAETGCC